MRQTVRLFALSALVLVPAGLLAQSVYFKTGSREEKWDINDPFAPAGTKIDDSKAIWKTDELTLEKGGVTRSHKATDIIRVDWAEPPVLLKARDSVERGDAATALQTIEPLIYKFDKIRKVPGSPWLKAAEVKLDALAQLSNQSALSAFITLLEENDDGSIPGLSSKLKLARLAIKVRDGDNTGVLEESEKLLGELEEPNTRARLFIFKADALLALRRYEESLNAYLQVPVFYGSEKAFIPVAYLGAAKALRAMDSPATHAQRLDLASAGYLRDIIRDFPVSKEADIAKTLLPREERVAEEKRALNGGEDAKPADNAEAEKPAANVDDELKAELEKFQELQKSLAEGPTPEKIAEIKTRFASLLEKMEAKLKTSPDDAALKAAVESLKKVKEQLDAAIPAAPKAP